MTTENKMFVAVFIKKALLLPQALKRKAQHKNNIIISFQEV